MTQPAPKPAFPIVMHRPAHKPTLSDWFQRQLVAARDAKRAYVPHSDTAGAQHEYYRVALAACTRIDEYGLSQYRARCNLLRQKSVATVPPPREDTLCDENPDDPNKVTACND